MPIYHGKDLWTHKGLDGKPAEPEAMIRQRMARDWGNALGLVKTSLTKEAPAPRSPSLMPRWRSRVDMMAQNDLENGRSQSKSGAAEESSAFAD